MTRKERQIYHALRTGNPIRQVAALPWRNTLARREILFVTSRRRGRLILPKGWPMRRRSAPEAAAIEALQEAGVAGRIGSSPIGWFLTSKCVTGGEVPLLVLVYPLQVTKILPCWAEAAQRRRVWVPLHAAADEVSDPGLADLLQRINLAVRALSPRAPTVLPGDPPTGASSTFSREH